MIRICPNCNKERPLSEFYCQTLLDDGSICNWDLSTVIVQNVQHPVPSSPTKTTSPIPLLLLRRCENGHEIGEGDLICLSCGGVPTQLPINDVRDVPEQTETNTDIAARSVTEIGGWSIETRLDARSAIREQFRVKNTISAVSGVMTLYADGSEPDPAVYDVIRGVSEDHLPKIYEVGRWQDRAFEVTEEIGGGA